MLGPADRLQVAWPAARRVAGDPGSADVVEIHLAGQIGIYQPHPQPPVGPDGPPVSTELAITVSIPLPSPEPTSGVTVAVEALAEPFQRLKGCGLAPHRRQEIGNASVRSHLRVVHTAQAVRVAAPRACDTVHRDGASLGRAQLLGAMDHA